MQIPEIRRYELVEQSLKRNHEYCFATWAVISHFYETTITKFLTEIQFIIPRISIATLYIMLQQQRK